MFSHAIPCQGGVTQAHRESVRGCWGGWLRLESKLVCWDGCDHVGDEGACGGGVSFRRWVLSGFM